MTDPACDCYPTKPEHVHADTCPTTRKATTTMTDTLTCCDDTSRCHAGWCNTNDTVDTSPSPATIALVEICVRDAMHEGHGQIDGALLISLLDGAGITVAPRPW